MRAPGRTMHRLPLFCWAVKQLRQSCCCCHCQYWQGRLRCCWQTETSTRHSWSSWRRGSSFVPTLVLVLRTPRSVYFDFARIRNCLTSGNRVCTKTNLRILGDGICNDVNWGIGIHCVGTSYVYSWNGLWYYERTSQQPRWLLRYQPELKSSSLVGNDVGRINCHVWMRQWDLPGDSWCCLH